MPWILIIYYFIYLYTLLIYFILYKYSDMIISHVFVDLWSNYLFHFCFWKLLYDFQHWKIVNPLKKLFLYIFAFICEYVIGDDSALL